MTIHDREVTFCECQAACGICRPTSELTGRPRDMTSGTEPGAVATGSSHPMQWVGVNISLVEFGYASFSMHFNTQIESFTRSLPLPVLYRATIQRNAGVRALNITQGDIVYASMQTGYLPDREARLLSSRFPFPLWVCPNNSSTTEPGRSIQYANLE